MYVHVHLQATRLEPSKTITAYIAGSCLTRSMLNASNFRAHRITDFEVRTDSTPFHFPPESNVEKEKAANAHFVDTKTRLLTTL